jgi:uncharacterized protein YegL
MSAFSPHGDGLSERIPIILVLDTSDSMGRPEGAPRIGELNAALREWLAGPAADPALRDRVEVAIITFNSEVQVLELASPGESASLTDSAFALAGDVAVPVLCASGLTLMLPAIETAVQLATRRTRELAARGVTSRRPVVWLVTDGAPCDEQGAPIPASQVAAMARRLRAAENGSPDDPGCLFYAVGVGGADMATLRELAPAEGSHRMLRDFSYRDILQTAMVSAVRQGAEVATDEYRRTQAMIDFAQRVRDLEEGLG